MTTEQLERLTEGAELWVALQHSTTPPLRPTGPLWIQTSVTELVRDPAGSVALRVRHHNLLPVDIILVCAGDEHVSLTEPAPLSIR